MIKKLNKISILLLFVLTSCGYGPIFSINNSNFKILSLSSEGDKKINYIIKNKLNYYKNIKADRSYKVIINLYNYGDPPYHPGLRCLEVYNLY